MRPRKSLAPHEVEAKEDAKRIVVRISKGEHVGLTVVQLLEIANVLERYAPLEAAHNVEKFLLYTPHVEIYQVDRETYLEAFKIAEEKKAGSSDAIAQWLCSAKV